MKFRPYILVLSAAISAALAPSVLATDYTQSDVRSETYCYPAKHATRTITQVSKVKDYHRDIVDIKMAPRFLIYDNGALPERYFIEHNGEEIDFTITDDGRVPDFVEKVLKSPKGAGLCIQDIARTGVASDDESLYFEMGLTPFFNNVSGRHDLAELIEGTKDGKAHYKAMIPPAVRAFMPSTKNFHIKYDNADKPLQIFAETASGMQPLEGEFFNEGYIISMDQLKNISAKALLIKGGDYKLAPVPSVSLMKRFGIGNRGGNSKAQTQAAAPVDNRTAQTHHTDNVQKN